jgi:hypothetical protein
MVVFTLLLAENPGLGVLKEGHNVEVEGVIDEIRDLSIRLRDARMKF